MSFPCLGRRIAIFRTGLDRSRSSLEKNWSGVRLLEFALLSLCGFLSLDLSLDEALNFSRPLSVTDLSMDRALLPLLAPDLSVEPAILPLSFSLGVVL